MTDPEIETPADEPEVVQPDADAETVAEEPVAAE